MLELLEPEAGVMVKLLDWTRMGLCTALGLLVIGLAAVRPDPELDASTSGQDPTRDPMETPRV